MKHILLVDDNVTNLKLAAQVLQPYYELSMAKSGKQALNYLKKNKPDLILLDLIMPEMDGYQTMEEIKLNPATQDIPIILLTADTQRESEIKALQLGALDFITKPFEEEVMLGRIEKILLMDDMRKELIEISDTDEKTGLYSYDYVKTNFEDYIKQDNSGAILLIYIQNFDLIKSQFSEILLDSFLKDLYNGLSDSLDISSYSCRIKDNLYLLTITEALSEDELTELMNKLYVNYSVDLEEDNKSVNVKIKIGSAIVAVNSTFENYYSKADKALYYVANTDNTNVHIFKEI